MVPESKRDLNFMSDREIRGESNVWSTAERLKKICGFDVHAGFE